MGVKGTYSNNNKQYYAIHPKELALVGEDCKW